MAEQVAQVADVSQVNTHPLGEPLDELAVEAPVEAPVEPEAQEPGLFEQAFWDADDAAVGEAFDALVDPKTGMIPLERMPGLVQLTWNVVVQNRLRQKEIALQIGTLMTAVSLLIEQQEQAAAKPAAKKRATKTPKGSDAA